MAGTASWCSNDSLFPGPLFIDFTQLLLFLVVGFRLFRYPFQQFDQILTRLALIARQLNVLNQILGQDHIAIFRYRRGWLMGKAPATGN